ncbi:hypothetical protein R1sor_006525 [Riccia sorocarpa]|uniref:Replitron HUH endonuclease domain-containing protein n=1 Tax=Riccia sorocarpa TaxID=122646 RepID=A0ABD3HQV3_9MARC
MTNARNAAPISMTSPLVPVAQTLTSLPTLQVPAAQRVISPPNLNVVKRRPGRPPGTGRKVAAAATTAPTAADVTPVNPTAPTTVPTVQKRGPGRPPGSGKKQTANPTDPEVKPPPKRRKTAALKMMELSVTISIAGSDISPTLFPLIQDFLQCQCHCHVGAFAIERGGSLLNLHLQGVVSMECSSAVDAKKRITAAIDWTEHRPVGAGACVKKLTNKGIHTFVGMVGYCLKDRQELHFRMCMKNITDAAQREGMLLFTFYGAADLKNRVELNPTNIMQRALQFNKFLSHHPLGTSFRGCLRRMIVSGHYTPSTSWVINKGMDRNHMAALWKCYIQPCTVSFADIDSVFFWMSRLQPSRCFDEAQVDSSDRPLEGIASNCICGN